MLTGKFPFKRIGKGNKKILNLDVNFELKSPLSNDAKDLIGKLLEKDINKRLTEPFDIMNHSFFKDVNWDDVYNKRITPPPINIFSNNIMHVYQRPRLFNDDSMNRSTDKPNPNMLPGWSFINNEK
jgi:serine/threonine protein kinase